MRITGPGCFESRQRADCINVWPYYVRDPGAERVAMLIEFPSRLD